MMNFLDEMRPKHLRKYVHSLMVENKEIKPLTVNDYVRASGIFDFCPREEFLAAKYNITRSEVIPERLWKTFRFGRVFETFFRDEILGNAGIVIGKWKCQICQFCADEVNGMSRYAKPKQCDVCGGNSFSYVEADLISADRLVGGHPDGFLHWNFVYSILELKTANDMNFSKVRKSPMDKHRAQVQVYMHLTDYKLAHVFYFNKDTSEDVLHEVPYEESEAKAWIAKANTWKQSIITGNSPDRLCTSADCSRAKKCHLRQLCFSNS